MSTTSAPKRKPAYDPQRQWGLKPADEAGPSATYVMGGHIVSGGGAASLYVGETMGREGQARAARKLSEADAERELAALLRRDKEGMRAVLKARETMEGKKRSKAKGKGKDERQGNETSLSNDEGNSDSELEGGGKKPSTKQTKSYSAQVIKQLGFDPAVKAGYKRADDASAQKKVCTASTSKRRTNDSSYPAHS